MPLGVAVVLVIGGLSSSAAFIRKNGASDGTGFSGVSLVASAYGAQSSAVIVDDASASLLASPSYDGGSGNYIAQEEGAAFDDDGGVVRDPGGTFADSTSQSGVISYKVRSGDTLPSIAQYFGITVDTITGANPKIKSGNVSVGQILKILPISGTMYASVAGDTLQSIASAFNVSESEIVQANPFAGLGSLSDFTFIQPGTSLIIPGGSGLTTSPSAGS